MIKYENIIIKKDRIKGNKKGEKIKEIAQTELDKCVEVSGWVSIHENATFEVPKKIETDTIKDMKNGEIRGNFIKADGITSLFLSKSKKLGFTIYKGLPLSWSAFLVTDGEKVTSKIINPREVPEEVKINTNRFLQKNQDLLFDSSLTDSVANESKR